MVQPDLSTIERKAHEAAENGDFKTASDYYEQLVNIAPSNAEYHFRYGGTLGLYAREVSKFTALGMLEEIKFHLKEAIRLEPGHIEARHALSQIYCELPGIVGGSYSKARDYAQELVALSPVDGYLALGYVAEHEEDFKTATKHYKKAIEIGQSETTYHKLAMLYKKMKEQRLALSVIEQGLSRHPESTQLDRDRRELINQG